MTHFNRNRQTRIENLQSREMLAADLALNDGVLEIQGTFQDDVIEVAEVDSYIHASVKVNGKVVSEASFHESEVSRLQINAKAGNDNVINRTDKDSRILGGVGNDHLQGGRGYNIILGGTGNDTLIGGKSIDDLYGQAGDDVIRGRGDYDIIYGGVGNDKIHGGHGNDEIYGGGGADRLAGGNGDDMLKGEGGKDRLFGGQGNDSLDGGGANDFLNGGAGNDLVEGGAGKDRLKWGGGIDVMKGGAGTDFYDGKMEELVNEIANVLDFGQSAIGAAEDALTVSDEVYCFGFSTSGSTSGAWGTAEGSAEAKFFGAEGSTHADFDFSDGNISIGAEGKAYVLNASVNGSVQTATLSVAGIDLSAQAEGSASVIVGAEASAQASLGTNGAVIGATAFVGVKAEAEGSASTDIGELNVGVNGNATAYAGAEATGTLSATAEGVSGEVTAFAGAKATATGGANVGGVGVEGTAEAWAGVGVEAGADVTVKNGKLDVEFGFGAALGVGGKTEVGFTVDFEEVADDFTAAADWAESTYQQAESEINNLGNTVVNTATIFGNTFTNTTTSVTNTVSNTASDAWNTFTSWF